MLVPLKWLKEFVDYPVDAQKLAHDLTMGGLEVDGVIERHTGLNKVVVAKVTGVETPSGRGQAPPGPGGRRPGRRVQGGLRRRPICTRA